jgi:SAM-dependent methyltransferase
MLRGSVLCLIAGALSCAAQPAESKDSLAPYIPSPQILVDRLLEAARLRPGELVYDLGSGDGRIVITAAQKYKARGVGVELSHKLFKAASERVKELGLDHQVRFVHENLLKVDISPADVVTIYLLTASNELLRPNLEKYLRPGARVVSLDFEIRGWTPTRVDTVEADRRMHRIYLYEVKKK